MYKVYGLITLRVLAALLGGYGLATVFAWLLISTLPMPPAQAVLWALLLSFLAYALAAMAAFVLWRAGGLRRSLAWLHTWTGLLPAWLLYFIFVTGTLGYLNVEIDRWMQPEQTPPITRADERLLIDQGLARLQQVAPKAERWVVELPSRKNLSGPRISWRLFGTPSNPHGEQGSELLQPAVSVTEPIRHTGGGLELYQMHYRLRYIPVQQAYWLVGLCSMCMLVSLLSGVIIHKRILRDFFCFRPASGVLSWRDAHTALGVFALPFHLMITYSGLVLLMSTYMPWVHDRIYDFDEAAQDEFFLTTPRLELPSATGTFSPLVPAMQIFADVAAPPTHLISYTVRSPLDRNARVVVARERSDAQAGAAQRVYDGVSGRYLANAVPARSIALQTRDTLIGLHKGLFAGPALRALYLLSGFVGSALIATGVVLWTVKRSQDLGAAWLRRLNPGIIVGLPLGIATYLCANRLLPMDLAGRGSAEINTLFIVWALALVYGLLRPARSAWRELALFTALAWLAVPCLDLGLTPLRRSAQPWQIDAPLLLFGSGALLIVGMAALSLSQAHRQRRGTRLAAVPPRLLRVWGALCLLAAGLLCCQADGGSRGWITWTAGLTLAALCVTALHTVRRMRLQR